MATPPESTIPSSVLQSHAPCESFLKTDPHVCKAENSNILSADQHHTLGTPRSIR